VDVQTLNLERLKQAIGAHWQEAGGFAATVLASVSQSGRALLGWVANLVLIPVVTFYLLRDWDVLVARVHDLLPRNSEPTVVRLARETDVVLGAFLRGQLSVMAALTLVYALGLWIVGLDLAFLIGLISGLVSFVPYLGFITGITLAGVAAYFQFHELLPLLWVALVFGIGQMFESMLLTPWLVGDKIGLHPVAVIFAVMAGGQLFGFIGVLLALPVAAVLMVLLREVRRRYVGSSLYATPGEQA
jgi:predicted PurR-regulated permease PerM